MRKSLSTNDPTRKHGEENIVKGAIPKATGLSTASKLKGRKLMFCDQSKLIFCEHL